MNASFGTNSVEFSKHWHLTIGLKLRLQTEFLLEQCEHLPYSFENEAV